MQKIDYNLSVVVTPDAVYDVSGIGYEPRGQIRKDGYVIDTSKEKPFLQAAQLSTILSDANLEYNPTTKKTEVIGDLFEGALLAFSLRAGISGEDFKRKHPILDSGSFPLLGVKRARIIKNGRLNIALFIGDGDILLEQSNFIFEEAGVTPITDQLRKKLSDQANGLKSNNLLVLGFATRNTSKNILTDKIFTDLIFNGFLVFIENVTEIKDTEPTVREGKRAVTQKGWLGKILDLWKKRFGGGW